MLLPSIECRPSHLGASLYASQNIPIGTVVWLPCSHCECVSAEELQAMSKEEHAFYDDKGYYLASKGILLPCQDACYMNHSCDANVLHFGLDFGIAIRDIAPNTQVYCDYRNWDFDPDWSMPCHCGASNCQEVIFPGQGKSSILQQMWLNKVKRALSYVAQVDQPLADILEECSEVYRLIKEKSFEYQIPSHYSIFHRLCLNQMS